MTPPLKKAGNGEFSARQLPTLGLLPVLAISAAVAGEAGAQTVSPSAGEDLGTIHLQTGGQGGEAANSYRVTEGASDKLSAPLVDTPKTVVVVTQKQMEERNATSVLEVLRTTPGITLGSGEGGTPMGDRFFMRGYQAATDMMIDGVRNLGRTTSESFNIESVEVVKGPGGAYSGRGATGGSVNLVTKQARVGESFNNASVLVGNGDQKRVTYDGNLDLGNDMALRLNLMAQDSGVPGRDVLKDDRKGIAAAFTKEFGASRISIGLHHDEAQSTPDLGVPMETAEWRTARGLPELSTANPGRPLEVMASEAFYGSAARDFRDVTNQSATINFEHDFSETLSLRTTMAWIGSEQNYFMTRPTLDAGSLSTVEGAEVVRALRAGGRKNSALAFQTALNGSFATGNVGHTFSLGFEHSVEKISSAIWSGGNRTPSVPNTSLLFPDPSAGALTGTSVFEGWGAPTTTTTNALYLFDTIALNSQWSVDLGLRYDRYKVETSDLARKDNMLNYSAAVVYKPADNGTIYLSVGTSSNPSGECAGMAGGADGAGACTLTANSAGLEPEESKSFELGTKWELFDNQLLLSAAIFNTEKKNARVSDPFGNVSLQGETRARGIEIGAAGQINDQWGISAGYAYTDTELVNGGSVNIGTSGSPNWVTNPSNGNDLQFVAKHSLSVWSTYELNDKWTFGGGATYTGKRFLDDENTMVLPAQWRFDAMVAYDIAENAALQINVNNLFDERLYDASHVGLFANRAPGRSVTAKIDYRF